MTDRNVIHLDRLDDQSDRVTDYQYDEIRDARCREHTSHLEQLPLHDLFRLQPFGVRSLQAILFHTLLHYQQEKFHDVVIRNQP